ncbi:MAG: T9SS type A sorting domain-containing protein [Bacteroidia bacterium]
MKTKILITVLLLSFSLASKAQITLDHVYPTDIPDRSVKLSLSGLKYVHVHHAASTISYFTLYNADHSIFKTITIPSWPGRTVNDIKFVSETLFDLDTLVEYAVNYTDGVTNAIRICNENANILFEVDSAQIAGSSVDISAAGFIPAGIFPDGTNTKLMLFKFHYSAGWTFTIDVYNLPGQLPCLECDGGLIAGIAYNPGVINTQAKAFPNPSTDHFNIKYILPANAKSVFIEIYDMEGSLVKKSRLNNKSNETAVNSQELSDGQFIYRIIADGKMIATDKIIVAK